MSTILVRLVSREESRGGNYKQPVAYVIEESGGRLWFRREAAAGVTGSAVMMLSLGDKTLTFDLELP